MGSTNLLRLSPFRLWTLLTLFGHGLNLVLGGFAKDVVSLVNLLLDLNRISLPFLLNHLKDEAFDLFK